MNGSGITVFWIIVVKWKSMHYPWNRLIQKWVVVQLPEIPPVQLHMWCGIVHFRTCSWKKENYLIQFLSISRSSVSHWKNTVLVSSWKFPKQVSIPLFTFILKKSKIFLPLSAIFWLHGRFHKVRRGKQSLRSFVAKAAALTPRNILDFCKMVVENPKYKCNLYLNFASKMFQS